MLIVQQGTKTQKQTRRTTTCGSDRETKHTTSSLLLSGWADLQNMPKCNRSSLPDTSDTLWLPYKYSNCFRANFWCPCEKDFALYNANTPLNGKKKNTSAHQTWSRTFTRNQILNTPLALLSQMGGGCALSHLSSFSRWNIRNLPISAWGCGCGVRSLIVTTCQKPRYFVDPNLMRHLVVNNACQITQVYATSTSLGVSWIPTWCGVLLSNNACQIMQVYATSTSLGVLWFSRCSMR